VHTREPQAASRKPRAETVTYNFDPDRWYENERLRLDHRVRAGELT
jgi:hypothetical protein